MVGRGDRKKAIDSHASPSNVHQSKQPREPRIKYGKRVTKPLSLNASQFRASVYDIPPDDDAVFDATLVQGGEPFQNGSEASVSQDSPLHDAEPLSPYRKIRERPALSASRKIEQAVEGKDGSPSSPFLEKAARSRKRTAVLVRTQKRKPVLPREALKEHRASPVTCAKICKPSKIPKTRKRKPSKTQHATPKRRLPVNELFLVTSPLNLNNNIDLDSHPIVIRT